jgi:hypothetical protein
MKQELLQKIQKIFLFLIIVFLPFTNLPQRFTISFVGANAVYYILLISLFLFVYEYYKYKFKIDKIIIYFFIVYSLYQIISLLHGLIIYPYYDLLDIGQIQKLQYINDKFNIQTDKNVMIGVYLFFRDTKNIILNSAYFCFIPLLFIHLFGTNCEKCFSLIEKAVIVLVCLLGLYSIPEIIYLKFNLSFARNILETINPFLYDVCSSHGWWPPLLWGYVDGQLRSLCPEPSYFCIIAVFCVPFFINKLYKKFSVIYILIFIYFILMILMSKSRTGLIIFIMEISMFLLFFINKFNKKFVYFMVILLACISLSMFVNLSMSNRMEGQKNKETITNYVENNIISAVKKNTRSNKNRMSNIIAMFKVGLEQPILGVGKGLKDAYIINNIPSIAEENIEFALWTEKFKENGLKSPFPSLNQYVCVFAENGIIGVIIFIFPVIYIFYKVLSNRKKLDDFYFVVAFIAFIGQLFAMMSDIYFITYPISLGLIYFYFNCIDKREKNEQKSINNHSCI